MAADLRDAVPESYRVASAASDAAKLESCRGAGRVTDGVREASAETAEPWGKGGRGHCANCARQSSPATGAAQRRTTEVLEGKVQGLPSPKGPSPGWQFLARGASSPPGFPAWPT
jgi:hypothetical protein